MIKKIIEDIKKDAEMKCKTAYKHYNKGMQDCELGIYDKWYRYNSKDDGAAYDAGWIEKNKTIQNETVKFL